MTFNKIAVIFASSYHSLNLSVSWNIKFRQGIDAS